MKSCYHCLPIFCIRLYNTYIFKCVLFKFDLKAIGFDAMTLPWRLLKGSYASPTDVAVGLSAYGRSYTLENTTCTTYGCPFREDSNETAIGGCLETTGFVPYVEIYDWTRMGEGKGYDSITVDHTTYSAVMVKDGNQFISYDNVETFKAKVDYASKKCLGGTMVWAIDMIPLGTQSSGSSGSSWWQSWQQLVAVSA